MNARGLRPWLALLLALTATPGGAAGQSLLGSGGLGIPITATDARARGLGGIGMGLLGASILPYDPASAADLITPAMAVTFVPTTVDVTSDAADPTASGNRFPVLGVSYPVSQLSATATLTVSGLLDQRWDAEVVRRIDTGAGEARVTDQFVSDGGVSTLNFGLARRISPTLAIGVTVGRYTGELDRTLTRSFDSLALETNVPPVEFAGRWNYSGTTATVGALLDYGDIARVSGSVTFNGTLTAEAEEETGGGDQEFSLPTVVRVGATGVLSPSLSLVLGASRADWSDPSLAELSGGGGRAATDFGAALELDWLRVLGRPTPLRVGYRSSDYPFRFEGEEVDESGWVAGLGWVFLAVGDVPFAQFDLSVERGDRSGGSVTEEYWRVGLSLRVAGF